MLLYDHNLLKGQPAKYIYKGNVNTEEIKKFLEDWKANKLQAFVMSEEIPASNDGPVKIVVGKNYNQIVRDSNDDVLLEFYAPWCGHCK